MSSYLSIRETLGEGGCMPCKIDMGKDPSLVL